MAFVPATRMTAALDGLVDIFTRITASPTRLVPVLAALCAVLLAAANERYLRAQGVPELREAEARVLGPDELESHFRPSPRAAARSTSRSKASSSSSSTLASPRR
jgi:hypothetical protein